MSYHNWVRNQNTLKNRRCKWAYNLSVRMTVVNAMWLLFSSWVPEGRAGSRKRGEERFLTVFRWSSNVHNFLRVCSLPSWQMLLEKPVLFWRKANLSRVGEGEGGSPSLLWRDDIKLDSKLPLACCLFERLCDNTAKENCPGRNFILPWFSLPWV